MITSEGKVDVLVLEDNEGDYNAIVKALGKKTYTCRRLHPFDNGLFLNYKALHPDNQIVIVDLDLGRGPHPKGVPVIRDYLWLADRTAFFVIFTERPDMLPSQSFGKDVEPHWAAVMKERVPKTKMLSDDCLKDLVEAVGQCRDYCTPLLESPKHGEKASKLFGQLNELMLSHPENPTVRAIADRNGQVWKSIEISAAFLGASSEAAVAFAKAGMRTSRIGVGVYGSYGRMEARETSDVECTVFFDEADNVKKQEELALVLWNRMMKYVKNHRLEFEGSMLVPGKDDILVKNPCPTGLPNRYMPIVSIDELTAAVFKDNPNARVKHFQFLMEATPVFNVGFLLDAKRQLVQSRTGYAEPHMLELVRHEYFRHLFAEFDMATHPTALLTRKDLKAFCFRVLNLLSLKIHLFGLAQFDNAPLRGTKEWQVFLDSLTAPGILKLLGFYQLCKANNCGKFIEDPFLAVLTKYRDVLSRLTEYETKRKLTTADLEMTKEMMYECLERFANVLKAVSDNQNKFDRVAELHWLLDNQELRDGAIRVLSR